MRMFSKMARGTFLLMLAVLVVTWALSFSKSEAQDPQNDWPTEPWSIYC